MAKDFDDALIQSFVTKHDLINILSVDPICGEILIKRIMELPDTYQRLFPHLMDLVSMLKDFPDHGPTFINGVLHNPLLNAHIFPSYNDFIMFRDLLPAYEKTVVRYLLKDSCMFNRLVNERSDLFILIRWFQDYTIDLLQCASKNNKLYDLNYNKDILIEANQFIPKPKSQVVINWSFIERRTFFKLNDAGDKTQEWKKQFRDDLNQPTLK